VTGITTYQDAATDTVEVGGAKFAYRQLGPTEIPRVVKGAG